VVGRLLNARCVCKLRGASRAVLRNRATSVAGWRSEAEGRREGKILYEVFQGTSSERTSMRQIVY
jgi:hypothetical protein